MVARVGPDRGDFGGPGLTARKLVEKTYIPGERINRTRDLALLHEDGAIQYLGRVDALVKIRGFRTELGEIEAVLAGHDLVKEAVVVDRETSGKEKYLYAYVLPEPGENRPGQPSGQGGPLRERDGPVRPGELGRHPGPF